MKVLPGVFAVSLLFAAVCTTSVLAQDGGGLVIISGGGGSTFSGTISDAGAGTLIRNGGATIGTQTYTGGGTLILSAVGATNVNTITGPILFGGNTNNAPVLPISLWPTLFGSPTVPGGVLTSGGTLSLTLGSPTTVLPYGGAGVLNLGSTTLGAATLGGATLGTIANVSEGAIIANALNPGSGATLTLSSTAAFTVGAATYTARTTVSGGTLVLNGNSNVVAGEIQVNGSSLQLNTSAPVIQVTAGTLQFSPAIQLSAQTVSPSDITLQTNTAPEPSSAVLLALGLAVPMWRARKRQTQA